MTTPETKRWLVCAEYQGENGGLRLSNDLDELSELDALIERGPDWGTLRKITITYQLGNSAKRDGGY